MCEKCVIFPSVGAAVFNKQCICCLICSAYQNEADINFHDKLEEQTPGLFPLVTNVRQVNIRSNILVMCRGNLCTSLMAG